MLLSNPARTNRAKGAEIASAARTVQTLLVRRCRNFLGKKSMSGIVDNDQQQAIRRQKERQRWATERFKPWGEPQPDDYDFGRWAKGASKALLEADCFYEYACESRRLRCLFVLISAARKRRDFEPCSFDGLLEVDARRTLGGALH